MIPYKLMTLETNDPGQTNQTLENNDTLQTNDPGK